MKEYIEGKILELENTIPPKGTNERRDFMRFKGYLFGEITGQIKAYRDILNQLDK